MKNLRRKIATGICAVGLAGVLSGCVMTGSPEQMAREIPNVPDKFVRSMFGMEQEGENNEDADKYTDIWNYDTGNREVTMIGWQWSKYIDKIKNFPKKGFGVFILENGKIVDSLHLIQDENGYYYAKNKVKE